MPMGNGGNSMKAADGVQIAERWAKVYAAAKAKEDERGMAGEPWACIVVTAIEELSAAEERERVLREAQTVSYDDITAWLRAFLIQEDAFGEGIPDFWDELNMTERIATALAEAGFSRAALTAAPEQPDRGVCPDCKSTTRSFRGRRGDEHGEWVCDNEWHAPEQGKEAKS